MEDACNGINDAESISLCVTQSKINVWFCAITRAHTQMVCATCQTSFQSQAARSGSLHDRLGACRLAVHAPLSVKMSCAGCGWAFEPSAQRPRTEWARESFRIDGPGIMSLEPQVAVKCRATLLCATPLILCLADLSRTRRESFVACRCSRAAVYPIAWEKLRLMRLGCGDGSGCEACWCASCESSGG